jgi:hypothetical protein
MRDGARIGLRAVGVVVLDLDAEVSEDGRYGRVEGLVEQGGDDSGGHDAEDARAFSGHSSRGAADEQV